MDHAKPVETEKDIQESILKFFLQQRQAYIVWACLFNSDRRWEESQRLSEKGTPLYYASLAGFGHTVESLLEKGANVNAPAGFLSGTALQAASSSSYSRRGPTSMRRKGSTAPRCGRLRTGATTRSSSDCSRRGHRVFRCNLYVPTAPESGLAKSSFSRRHNVP
jgi:hypothetical protein